MFIAFVNVGAQGNGQWELLNEGIESRLSDMDFVNEDVGWICGERTLLKTEDGGKIWNSIPTDENYEFYKIDFSDESVGYAIAKVTSGNLIIKSQDGGLTWFIKLELPDSIQLKDLHVVKDSVAYVLGKKLILKTSDGGSSWIDISPDLTDKFLYSVWFITEDVGVVTGRYLYEEYGYKGLILRTIDGGMTWEEIIVPEVTGIYTLQFINDSTGYSRAGNSDREVFIYATTDTGRTWTIRTQHSSAIECFFYKDENTAYAIMDDTTSSFPRFSFIMKSIDGGYTWTNKYTLGPIGNIGRFRSSYEEIYISN